jgi:hypothetical protein
MADKKAGKDFMYLGILQQRLTLVQSAGIAPWLTPALVAAILAVVQALIENCPSRSPAALRHRLGNRARIALALFRDIAGVSLGESFTIANKLLDLANDATDDELRGLVADCCS